MAEGNGRVKSVDGKGGGDREREGCQVSGFGRASVHSSPLYLG